MKLISENTFLGCNIETNIKIGDATVIVTDWREYKSTHEQLIKWILHEPQKRERASKVIRGEKTGRAIKKHEVTA